VHAREPVRTGALRDSTRSFVDVRDAFIRGRVRIVAEDQRAAIKAGSLEYGVHRSVPVSPHEMELDHVFDQPIDPEEVMVEAYSRDVNLTAMRFLRDSLSDSVAAFEIAVQNAMNEAVGGFNLTQVNV
jgi:hypothetical protein